MIAPPGDGAEGFLCHSEEQSDVGISWYRVNINIQGGACTHRSHRISELFVRAINDRSNKERGAFCYRRRYLVRCGCCGNYI